MKRVRRTLGALVLGAIVASNGAPALAQTNAEIGLKAQLASITLDASTLPDGYLFEGEAFLTADQIATEQMTAKSLTDAGFIVQYVSIYKNPSTSGQIRSYASAWNDADAATAGFEIIEDEGASYPDAEFTDADSSIGEEPREVSTGTYPSPDLPNASVNTVDVTFRADRFLVGVAVESTDGSEVDAGLADSLAGEIEARATAVIGGDAAEGTDLALAPQVLPVPGRELQSGFLSATEVEQIYGLQGSSLGSLTASWDQVVALGSVESPLPLVATGLTSFKDDAAAKAVIDQVGDLTPDSLGAEALDGVEVEGADNVVAYSYTSPITDAGEPDSVRIFFTKGNVLGVIDVQGASNGEVAQGTATGFATAQIACIGAESCAPAEIPTELKAD